MIYCLVPSDLAARLTGVLERTWQDHESVAVVVERRVADRRQSAERRDSAQVPSGATDRRRVVYGDGRRIAERRGLVVPVAGLALPRKARPHAGRLLFVETVEAPAELHDGIEAARAIVRLQLGDEGATRELYDRYFDRIYSYLRITLKHSSEAEERTGDVFVKMLEELPRLALGPTQILPWLFTVTQPVALAGVPAAQVVEASSAADSANGETGNGVTPSLDWVSDDELQLLIERRPLQERQVLMLRYMARLGFVEIGAVLGVAPSAAADLHAAAVRSLEASLAAISRSPRLGGRHPMTRLAAQTPVLRQRRRALAA